MINSCITVVEKEVFVHFYMIFRSKWLRWAEVTLTLKCLCHVLIQLNCEKLLKITEVCGCQPQHFELLLVKKSGLQNEFSNSKGCSRSCCGECVSGLDKIWHFWKVCSVWLSWWRRDPVTNSLQLLHMSIVNHQRLNLVLFLLWWTSLLYLFVSLPPVQWIFPEALRISSGLQLAARIRQRWLTFKRKLMKPSAACDHCQAGLWWG